MQTYYSPEDLSKFPTIGEGAPELWKKFSEWYGAVFAEGALTEREKALIALAVARLEKGSNKEQMTEAVHVAAAIRGGASLVHGVQMKNVIEKISM
ncbi:MAG: alkylhydroperoxidase like protein, AhpD family [Deltaproteobacteria bacterium]|nr:alkylhydroperoxidase like protein, AhpD family [Deltaproteobacteria bacterium]